MMKKACKNKMTSSKQVGRSKILFAELCFLSSLKWKHAARTVNLLLKGSHILNF